MDVDDQVIQYATSGDIHLAYAVVGDGPVDLVWFSAGVTNVEALDAPYTKEIVDRLSSFSRLITFDQRGVGLSDPVPPQATLTLEQRMDDIRAVLDAAGSERAVVLGQGYGGPTAILFAGTYPARVSSLVLYGTYARWLRADDYPDGMPAAATARYQDAVRSVWGTGGTIQAWAPSLIHDEAARRVWARTERLGASPAAISAQMSLWTETDVRGILPSIRVPTLVAHSTGDEWAS